MHEIIAVFRNETLAEARAMPGIREEIGKLVEFFAETSLTDGRRTANIDTADIPSLGLTNLRSLEVLVVGRFRSDGDLHVLLEGGMFVNVSRLARDMHALLGESDG